MVNMLKYGNPPAIEDCADIGTVPPGVAPTHLKNEGDFAGIPGAFNADGFKLPDHRRAWLTVAHYRRRDDIPYPYSVRIPGLGKLVYHNQNPDTAWEGDNWTVLEERAEPTGEEVLT